MLSTRTCVIGTTTLLPADHGRSRVVLTDYAARDALERVGFAVMRQDAALTRKDLSSAEEGARPWRIDRQQRRRTHHIAFCADRDSGGRRRKKLRPASSRARLGYHAT